MPALPAPFTRSSNTVSKRPIDHDVYAACDVCGARGRLGPDIVITGSGHAVHRGICHESLSCDPGGSPMELESEE